jgi:hypothetical protein
MDRNKYLMYGLGAIGILIVLYFVYMFFKKPVKLPANAPHVLSEHGSQTPGGEGQENYAADPREQLAKRLTSGGWVLFSMPGCPHCVRQVDEFGEFVRLLNVVEADSTGSNLPESVRSGKGFPCWYNTKTQTQIEGYQSPEQLIEKCCN